MKKTIFAALIVAVLSLTFCGHETRPSSRTRSVDADTTVSTVQSSRIHVNPEDTTTTVQSSRIRGN